MPKIISVVGGFVTDLVSIASRCPDAGETLTSNSFTQHPGGKGANSAVAAYRLSHRRPSLQPDPTTQSISTRPAIARASSSSAPPGEHGNSPHGDQVNGVVDATEGELQQGNNDLAIREGVEPGKHWNQELADDEIQVRMTGALGEDSFADTLMEVMTENSVDISRVRKVKEGVTGVGVVIVETAVEENRILFYPGANYELRPAEFETLESLNGPDGGKPDLLISQMELRRETVEQLLQTANEHNVDTLLNPAPAHALKQSAYKMITHLVVNETEAAMLADMDVDKMTEDSHYSQVTDEFLKRGVPHVVVTLGAKGAYYATATGIKGHVEAEKDVNVKDTTGAGYVDAPYGLQD